MLNLLQKEIKVSINRSKYKFNTNFGIITTFEYKLNSNKTIFKGEPKNIKLTHVHLIYNPHPPAGLASLGKFNSSMLSIG